MFLSELKTENKENFLKLCVYAAMANGIFADEEKTAVFAYCREMNVEAHIPETTEDFEELLHSINENTDKKEKNIFILEILALVKSDGVYDEQEVEFMNKLVNGLGLSAASLDKFNELLEKYIEVGKDLYKAISE